MIQYTTESQVRRAFWECHKGYIRGRGKGHDQYNATIRTDFSFFVDSLHRDGLISDQLAFKVTLG